MRVLLIDNLDLSPDISRRQLLLPYKLGLFRTFLKDYDVDSDIFDFAAEFSSMYRKGLLENIDSSSKEDVIRTLFCDIDFTCYGKIIISLSVLSDYSVSVDDAVMILRILKDLSGKEIIIGGRFTFKSIIYDGKYQDHLENEIISRLLEYSDYIVINSDLESLADIISRKPVIYNTIAKGMTLVPRKVSKSISDSIFNLDCDLDGVDFDKYRFSVSDLLDGVSEDNIPKSDIKIMLMPFMFMQNCDKSCAFCLLKETPISYLPVDNVISKLRRLHDRYGIKDFMFLNNHLAFDENYTRELAESIIDSGMDIRWSDSMRVNSFDIETYELIKRSGCVMLSFGIETVSPMMLKFINKGYTLDQVYQTMANCSSSSIRMWTNFIVGFPYQSHEDIVNLQKFIYDNSDKMSKIGINIFTLDPNTKFYENPDEYGIDIHYDEGLVLPPNYGFVTVPYSEKAGFSWKDKLARNQIFFNTLERLVNVRLPEENRNHYSRFNTHMIYFLDRYFGGDLKRERQYLKQLHETVFKNGI